MKRFMLVWVVVVVLSLGAAVAQAQDDGAIVTRGTGCAVIDANTVLWFDPDCTWQRVQQYDEDGNLLFSMYRDKGSLPPGAAFPTEAIVDTFFGYNYVVTPSGEFTSSIKY